jgi:hypothetical protein
MMTFSCKRECNYEGVVRGVALRGENRGTTGNRALLAFFYTRNLNDNMGGEGKE